MLERDGIIADGEVNSEVRRVCVLSLKALGALGGFYNISYAAKGWNEYKAYTYTGYTYKRSDRLNLDSWGDEEDTDANLTKNEDGTVSHEAHTIHFADPYVDLFNIVKLITYQS